MAHKYTPTTYNQVLKNPYRDNWLEAITAELDTLNRANALKHHNAVQYSTVLHFWKSFQIHTVKYCIHADVRFYQRVFKSHRVMYCSY